MLLGAVAVIALVDTALIAPAAVAEHRRTAAAAVDRR
jgi:hypothetical protein